MKKQKEICPFLKIDGSPVYIGDLYFTIHKETLNISDNVAGRENNVSYLYYFRDRSDAVRYRFSNLPLFSKNDIIRLMKNFDNPNVTLENLIHIIEPHVPTKKTN